jgi:electron transfer flavoprotein alpha subunit
VILVLVEQDSGRPDPSSLEALTFARRLAADLDLPVGALLLGAGSRLAAGDIGRYGVEVAHIVEDERLAAYAPAAWGRCLADLVITSGPRLVVGAGTVRGHEVLGYAAAVTDRPLAANCVDVRIPAAGTGEAVEVTRQRWGGSVLEDAHLAGTTAFLTVAEHALAPEPASVPVAVRIEPLAAHPSHAELRVRLAERVAPAGGRVSLADARVVVGGGRGVGGPEAFALLEELARLLGGTVGVSRVVTSAGWRPHTEQVGQTGTRIAPDLYIACGISGAIQHIVGCRSAKAILAINTDRDAPIMSRASHAVIGDLHAVVPAIIAELQQATASTSEHEGGVSQLGI